MGGVGRHDDKSDVQSGRHGHHMGVLAGSIDCAINFYQQMGIQVWGVRVEFVTAVKTQKRGS